MALSEEVKKFASERLEKRARKNKKEHLKIRVSMYFQKEDLQIK